MSVKWLLGLLVPLALATTLGACENQGVRPGVVQNASGYRGETGRVVSIREVPLSGSTGSGVSQGTLVGGGLGAAGGAITGAAIGHNAGSAVLGGVLGAVGGAIAGTAIDRNGGTRRGIEVTVQKDDGSKVTIAQPDDGDVQMGDRVVVVYDSHGVAKAVRDTSYRRD
ncbi:outer membrane lipoprotein SlyB [Enhydrobacter aerosaccus]|uniref:Outer membrane lipoprotein SlyB n=1 Tax=Enhydrobacter aerosaccus TaxID=225324 RepID=A0A1T4LJJ5_9HYPH|nr:outer membrane lipoprotein SlyB [Enhydrobacter aerosaccus]